MTKLLSILTLAFTAVLLQGCGGAGPAITEERAAEIAADIREARGLPHRDMLEVTVTRSDGGWVVSAVPQAAYRRELRNVTFPIVIMLTEQGHLAGMSGGGTV